MTGSLPQPAAAQIAAETPVAAPSAVTDGLTPRQRFDRRRRRVNLGVLAMLALFCVLFYAISMVKLAHYGLAWIE
jgi:hypothetical protein